MKIFVFTGPTLTAGDASQELDAVYLPPAAQGDVYTAARQGPVAIGIIDGFFERVPSIWHKEILWALSRGVHVFGAASMGALRAAELAAFGMVGVGEVFEAYASGELEDDDEVAVVHGPVESGFAVASEAMVNIRATLHAARSAGILGQTLCDRLIATAKSWYYPRRTYARLLRAAAEHGEPADELQALDDWLKAGKIDRKRDDAVAMLREMRSRLAEDSAPRQSKFPFHATCFFERLRCRLEERPLAHREGTASHPEDALLEELRLRGPEYLLERERAMVRLLALRVADRSGYDVDEGLGVYERETMTVDEMRTTAGQSRLARDESLVRRIRAIYSDPLNLQFREHLWADGSAAALRERSNAKQARLAERGLENPSLADVGLDEERLWNWYFGDCLDIRAPDDLEAWARSLDYASLDSLRLAVLREYCYRRLLEDRPIDRQGEGDDGRAIGATRPRRV